MSPIRHFFETRAIQPYGPATQMIVEQGTLDSKIAKMEKVYNESSDVEKLDFGIENGIVVNTKKFYKKYEEICNVSLEKKFL